jgi:hypothetical protein
MITAIGRLTPFTTLDVGSGYNEAIFRPSGSKSGAYVAVFSGIGYGQLLGGRYNDTQFYPMQVAPLANTTLKQATEHLRLGTQPGPLLAMNLMPKLSL